MKGILKRLGEKEYIIELDEGTTPDDVDQLKQQMAEVSLGLDGVGVQQTATILPPGIVYSSSYDYVPVGQLATLETIDGTLYGRMDIALLCSMFAVLGALVGFIFGHGVV